MRDIPYEDFMSFVRGLQGKVLKTRTGRSEFTVRVVGEALEFTPMSTRRPRGHTRAYVERVLEQYRRTGSLACTGYKFTVNATYQLTLIARYVAETDAATE